MSCSVRLSASSGASTVTTVGLVTAGLFLLGALLAWLAVSYGAVRAAGAADLAALAAADTARGLRHGQPCQQAAQVAQANGGTLQQCLIIGDGRHAKVVVSVPVTILSPQFVVHHATGRAHAGPPPLQ
ncbi:Rv3654c family TadE-like protein [Glutamicibacter sp. X7]